MRAVIEIGGKRMHFTVLRVAWIVHHIEVEISGAAAFFGANLFSEHAGLNDVGGVLRDFKRLPIDDQLLCAFVAYH